MSNRCSYCHEAGHNRISCPARKDAVERHRQEIAEGVRGWSSLVEQQDSYERRKKSARKCSYCYYRHHTYEYDHNRRNCPRLAEDKAKKVLENKEWRVGALNVLKERGIGAGAVFDHRYHGRCVITRVHWDNISCLLQTWYDSPETCFTITTLKSMALGRERERGVGFPRFGDGAWASWRSASPEDFEMVVPATARFIEADVPDGWREGITGLDFYFSSKRDKNH